MRRRDHQSGFSTTVILLVVLVVAALAVTGLVVYQHHKPSSAKTSAATNQTQTTTTQPKKTTTTQPTVTTAQALDIKEWGVHLTLDSTTASLYYYIKPSLPNVAYLSLKTISDVAPKCAADKFSLGAIVRLTPAEQQTAPNADFSIPGTKQIGNYWYGYSNPQSGCTDDAAMDAAVSKAAPNFNTSTLQNTFNTLAAD